MANPARDGGAELAKAEYERLMAEIFRECRRVLRDDGLMTLMFTHKSQDAWETLTRSLIESGWTITASFPVESEGENSMHQKDVAAAASSIFISCRKRPPSDGAPALWQGLGGQGVAARFDRACTAGAGRFRAAQAESGRSHGGLLRPGAAGVVRALAGAGRRRAGQPGAGAHRGQRGGRAGAGAGHHRRPLECIRAGRRNRPGGADLRYLGPPRIRLRRSAEPGQVAQPGAGEQDRRLPGRAWRGRHQYRRRPAQPGRPALPGATGPRWLQAAPGPGSATRAGWPSPRPTGTGCTACCWPTATATCRLPALIWTSTPSVAAIRCWIWSRCGSRKPTTRRCSARPRRSGSGCERAGIFAGQVYHAPA